MTSFIAVLVLGFVFLALAALILACTSHPEIARLRRRRGLLALLVGLTVVLYPIATFAATIPSGFPPSRVLIDYNGNLWLNSGTLYDASGNPVFSGSSTAETVTSAVAKALAVGPNGATNPVLAVDGSVSSQADGVSVQGQAAGSGAKLIATSSGSNAGFTFVPKGSGLLQATENSVTVPVPVFSYVDFSQANCGGTTAGNYVIWTAPNTGETWQVDAVSATFATASTSGTLDLQVDATTTAPGAGTTQLTGTLSLAGVANTAVNGTTIATPTTIAAGNRLTVVSGGTLTNLLNCHATVALKKVS